MRTDIRAVSLTGYAFIMLFFGAFGFGAGTMPLASAVIVPGVVEAAGSNAHVQHLEGGLIHTVHVVEGEHVQAGATLITMDGTAVRAQMNTYINQWVGLQARRARLIAQRDNLDEIVFDDDMRARADRHGLSHLLVEQRDEFAARRASLESEKIILRQRVAAIRHSLVGYESQRVALVEQRTLIAEEAERKHTLLVQGLTNRSEYTALLRSLASLVGQIGALESTVEQARLRIIEAEEQLVRSDAERITQALAELGELSVEIGRLEEQIIAEEHILNRLIVSAPVDGFVVRLPHRIAGSVVSSGAVMAELLPTQSDLVVEARLDPADIDSVREGQGVQLRLVALNRRTTPQIDATVAFISSDRLRDEVTGQEYFAARMALAGELPSGIDARQIYPGMPTEVFIPTESRTFLEYLAKPITDSFQRAFRES